MNSERSPHLSSDLVAVSRTSPTDASEILSAAESLSQDWAAADLRMGAPGVSVVHAIAGRLRLKIPRIAHDTDYANRLNWVLESFDFITCVRLNPSAHSLVIYFQPYVSLTEVQQHLLTGLLQAEATPVPVGAILTKTELRPMINWVERLGLPLASLGLAVLANQFLLPIPALLVGTAVLAASLPFVQRVVEMTVTRQQLDTDLLDILWLGLYTLKGDFVAPALMVSLIETGDALRDITARASERQVVDLLSGIDQQVRVERDGQEVRVPLTEVQRGDRIIVYAGEIIPVSGRVLRGTAVIDEHKLTGESSLVSRSEGQVVHASTQMVEGKLCILTKRIGENTRVGLTVKLLRSAPIYDTRVQDYSTQVSNAVTGPSLILGGLIFLFTRDISRALAPLHLDFGYGIRIAVPSSILSALTYAARHGIYIRSGRALEMLAKVDTVVFDKTGTLTQGNAEVVGIKTATRRGSRAEVLRVAASTEQSNTHPVSAAILRAAAAQKLESYPCDTWQYRVGLGVIAQINGQPVLVGSGRLMRQEGIDIDPIHERHPDLKTGSESHVYVARNGKLLGVILYTDPPRPESSYVIADLEQQGYSTYILTGDSQRVASRVADQLGVARDHVYAGAYPDRKVAVIQELQQQGKIVAFVGEGINDAAALAHADVSISFASGIDIARETAEVVLLEDDLRGIVQAIAIAQRAMEIVYQNTAMIAIPNISVVLAGIFLALDPVLSVVISNGAALVAELNSFRPLFTPQDDPIHRLLSCPPQPEEPSHAPMPCL
ncbi:MAG: heavy metal translocating P-type ATPase [Oculatellaceae cyanobacterium Prado106]|nr:heavy metal translocating P-type ATPase [Oculatellaceae cyanobacterium Prado106]